MTVALKRIDARRYGESYYYYYGPNIDPGYPDNNLDGINPHPSAPPEESPLGHMIWPEDMPADLRKRLEENHKLIWKCQEPRPINFKLNKLIYPVSDEGFKTDDFLEVHLQLYRDDSGNVIGPVSTPSTYQNLEKIELEKTNVPSTNTIQIEKIENNGINFTYTIKWVAPLPGYHYQSHQLIGDGLQMVESDSTGLTVSGKLPEDQQTVNYQIKVHWKKNRHENIVSHFSAGIQYEKLAESKKVTLEKIDLNFPHLAHGH